MSEPSVFEELPGDLMMWVLIVSELLVFGAGLAAFLGVRMTDPAGFAAAQDHLNRAGAGLNTMVLVSSGALAAWASQRAHAGDVRQTRIALGGAVLLGVVFMAIKVHEYALHVRDGISWDTHPFYTFYYGLTGFHAAHVIAGMVILGLIAIRPGPRNVEVGASFWHMVDLVWVILFPVVYLLR